MKSGLLRHIVDVKVPTYARQGTGQKKIVGYTTLLSQVPARCESLGGMEGEVAGRVEAELKWRIIMRFEVDVPEDAIIVYNGRTLNVSSVSNPDERDEELIIWCDEKRR